jgi:hypothetical protein
MNGEITMELLPMAMIMSDRATTTLRDSALPNAPVVPGTRRRARLLRTRTSTARLLTRVAQAITPTMPTQCDPAR